MSKNRRVVITGLGIVSSLGNTFSEVRQKLSCGESGVEKVQSWADLGLDTTIAGTIKNIDEKKNTSGISNKLLSYGSECALYCTLAANDAIKQSGLKADELSNISTGCIVGTGISSLLPIYETGNKLYQGKAKRIIPYTVCQTMASSPSALIANIFSIQGRSYSISSACATSTHNIGHAYELIKHGLLDTAIAGGGEEINEIGAAGFCAMRLAVSTHYNDTPNIASRPYDLNRDGFVISGGGGILVLEELSKAKSRGAHIFAEIISFAANSDTTNMILPEANGHAITQCMLDAINKANITPGDIDYINTHGTSTIEGDLAEVNAIRKIFSTPPPFSSTKSMTGHALAASGVCELIYSIAMLEDKFIAPSINIENIDPKFAGLPIVTKTVFKPIDVIMKNSFGFGGTNAVILLKSY